MRYPTLAFLLLCIAPGVLAEQAGFWAPVLPPRARYHIEYSFDPSTAQLSGSETINFRNSASRPMERLALDWSIGPKQTVFVTANGKPATIMVSPQQSETNAPLLLQLPEALQPGTELNLKLDFPNSYQSEKKPQYFLLQSWYPKLWWGFGAHDDYFVRITLPQGWSAATSGVRDASTGTDWNAKDIRDFTAFVLNQAEYTADQDHFGDVQITAVHTAAGAKCAKLVLNTAVDVIAFYRQRFGFYPHRSLTIIPGMDYPAGGYPVATAMVAIHGQEQMDKKPEAHFRWIAAQEVGRMYWSQHVLAAGADDLDWLLLGLGIFADREYRRARNITPPIGNLPAAYVNGLRDGFETTMDLGSDQEELIDWDFNNIVQHGKSSAMMDALESTIGVPVFDRGYRRCLREFNGRRMSWHDFEKVCEEESGEDLDWFFESWTRTNQYAFYKLKQHESEPT